ncbi:hypothetical protein P280DRAFT_312194 [Massarina eburnea CBS 473.64]|uniref:Microbial-type PARG catalytic domain-containing protein n=1 Tax=Massarina eburnea CBS 473.64 TaxID=1395130 RepID=A0A6A6S240_9PLEO|nr:hypothetical protein P280DRAFT_312194 [Massarina eburnea CBS 473.64]
MSPSKSKPSEIAAEAKRRWLPYIWSNFVKTATTSYLYPESAAIKISPDRRSHQRIRVAVLEGDPVNHALGWYQTATQDPAHRNCKRIPVVNTANEKRAGGDWESGLMAPEECFARRSNLVQALTMPWNAQIGREETFYPIPQRGGIYSPEVFVFRSGPEEDYATFAAGEIVSLPVISVAPVRRPKLDESQTRYSFTQEQELMKEKMRTVLRLASYCGHRNLVVGAFGLGPHFRNPTEQVAMMWKDLLFKDAEFQGAFTDVAFVIESIITLTPPKGDSDFEIFRNVFDPTTIFPIRQPDRRPGQY